MKYMQKLRESNRGVASTILVLLLASATLGVLWRLRSTATIAPAAVTCLSVSCETRIVFDSQAGGIQHPPPCVNYGCVAGCYGGDSVAGEGWKTCLCGGQVEPNCCRLLYKSDGAGGYLVQESAGGCSSGEEEEDPFSECPPGVCSIDGFYVSEPVYYELFATCGG